MYHEDVPRRRRSGLIRTISGSCTGELLPVTAHPGMTLTMDPRRNGMDPLRAPGPLVFRTSPKGRVLLDPWSSWSLHRSTSVRAQEVFSGAA
jgi:hypothetical protein